MQPEAVMDLDNPVIELCVQGTQAEFAGRIQEARELYWEAWESSTDDYEACVAAHYVARHQETHAKTFRWNLEALERADKVQDDRVRDFYPSLYLNMGYSFELLGNQAEAKRYYTLASALGVEH